MREGPLADLFRSTVQDGEPEANGAAEAAEEETRQLDSADEAEAAGRHPEVPTEHDPDSTEPPAEETDAEPPEPEEVTVYRVEDEAETLADTAPPPSKERLRDIFVEDEEGKAPTYGRAEPQASSRSFASPGVPVPVIRVVGVGGAGVNAVNRMVEAGVSGVEFLAVNTDLQSLQQSTADVTVHIGGEVTRGLGSGSDPTLGYKAAFEEQDKIKRLLKGSDMVFVTAGVGGGTGTGAAPVVARLAQTVGALTVGIVTKPFAFEGTRRASQAEEGIGDLESEVDTLIVVPNERLLSILSRNTSMIEAFGVADDVLHALQRAAAR